MAQTIKLKRSSTGGAVPSTSSLSLGEVAINTYDGKMYIKKNDGSDAIVEIGAGNGEAVWNSYDYTATSSQTSFSGSDNNSETLSYVPNFLQVFLNGILLDPAVDYTATTGNSIVLTVGASTSDLIQIETFTQIIGTGDILVDTFPVSSTQTAFTLSQDPINKSNISVYVEGVYQESSTYSLSGTTLTLSESPANGTTVEVVIGTRNVTLDGIVDLTISGTLHAGALDLGDANIINVNEISLDTIKGDADANTNITFAGSDVTTFTQGGQERLRLNTTGAQVTGNIVVSGTVDGRDVAADGVTADAALSRAGGAMGGAITTNSTFDGRDVSVDGTKLDGIESGATADQTDVEIRAAVESASDSNVFTNADHNKLDAIEALADVTDATNVTAAGALMDSEVTNLAQVKAFASSDYATAAQGTTANAALPKAGGTMTGTLVINQGGSFSKLDMTTSRTGATENIGGVQFYNSSNALRSQMYGTNDGKLKLATNGSTVALTLDASQNATFAGTISAGVFTTNANTGTFSNSIGTFPLMTSTPYDYVAKFESTDSGAAIIIEDNNSTSNANRVAVSGNTMKLVTAATTALTINASQNATFAGTISSGAISATSLTTSAAVSVTTQYGATLWRDSTYSINLIDQGWLATLGDYLVFNAGGATPGVNVLHYLGQSYADFGGYVTAPLYKVGTTTVIDANTNITAGTISSGAINSTASSTIQGNLLLDASNAEVNLKSGGSGTSGAINWTYNTTGTNYASIALPYDTRASTGLHIDSGYPITIDSASGTGIKFDVSGSNRATITGTGLTVVGAVNTTAAVGQHTLFNSTGADADFRVRTGATTHSLYVEGNTGHIGLGTGGPVGNLHIVGGDGLNGSSTIGGSSNEFIIENNADAGMTFRSGANAYGVISFADPDDHNTGQIYYRHSSNKMTFVTNDAVQMTVDSAGTVDVANDLLTNNAKLKAIAESNTDTAVDVFVYDTRKDSDGGAWRKRTQTYKLVQRSTQHKYSWSKKRISKCCCDCC